MDPILQILLGWQLVIFSLGIAAVIVVIRRIVDYILDNFTRFSQHTKIWNGLILPILPVLLGGIAGGVLSNFPYPDGLTVNYDRVIFGLVAGLFSTLLYKVINSLLGDKLNTIVNGLMGNVPPPPPMPPEIPPPSPPTTP